VYAYDIFCTGGGYAAREKLFEVYSKKVTCISGVGCAPSKTLGRIRLRALALLNLFGGETPR